MPYEQVMRSFVVIGAAVVLVMIGCNNGKITDYCETSSRTGSAPNCVLAAECVGTHTGVQLDCSQGNGMCVCSENSLVGQTVPYQDKFCTAGSSTDLEDSLEAANDACGWKL
jgi:hypothetical protein